MGDKSSPRHGTSGGRQAAHDHADEGGKPVEYYQRRLMEVEKQLRETQDEGEAEPTSAAEGGKKAAPWWKVW